jgi:holo-ACP synthase/triphosphoribosyl-dephospho-CoA synthase
VRRIEITEEVTGFEAVYVVDMDPLDLKAAAAAIEDGHGLGRLFDMDVIGPDFCKLDRETVGGGSRNCIVCGAPGRGCASRRLHSVQQLQEATGQILRTWFREADAVRIGELAVQSLLDEAETTPKPGLVDCRNSGSHTDMDIASFRASAAALGGYFTACARTGMVRTGAPGETFRQLRELGLKAERDMYTATGGVNTHKGAIFTMGILCGAAGRLWRPEGTWCAEEIFREAAAMTAEAMEEDFRGGGDTAGFRLYGEYGIRGIRGEVADGLPSVAKIGLPVYQKALNRFHDRNAAGIHTLLTLIANVCDTNMLKRGGPELAREAAARCSGLISGDYSLSQVEELDHWFMERNLSPGGCADLLAAVYFIHGLLQEKEEF